jgi:hypothetical protein
MHMPVSATASQVGRALRRESEPDVGGVGILRSLQFTSPGVDFVARQIFQALTFANQREPVSAHQCLSR